MYYDNDGQLCLTRSPYNNANSTNSTSVRSVRSTRMIIDNSKSSLTSTPNASAISVNSSDANLNFVIIGLLILILIK